MIPHEREMVKRLEGKPFVLVSVSCDDKKEKLVGFLKQEPKGPMPWTQWWSGPGGVNIEAWEGDTIPRIYVIDAKGVIRYRDVRGKDMDRAVDALLAEAS